MRVAVSLCFCLLFYEVAAQTIGEIDSLYKKSFSLVVTAPSIALELSSQAELKSQAIGYKAGESDALSVKAHALEVYGRVDEALPLLLEALKIRINLGDHSRISNAYSNISNTYLKISDFDAALSNLRKAKLHAQILDNDTLISRRNYQIGKVFSVSGIYDSAMIYLNLASQYFSQIKDSSNLWEVELDKAGVDFETNNYPEAIGIATNARNYFERHNDFVFKTLAEKLLAMCYEYAGDDEASNHYYRAAYTTAESLKNLAEMTEISEYYAQFLDSINSPEANHWYALSLSLKDSLYNHERTAELSKWQARFETEEKERELAKVKLKKAEGDAQLASQRQWIMALGGLILLVSMGTGFFVYRSRQRELQRKAKAEIRFRKQLLDATVTAQEEERQRIAKDLHDGLVQTLAAIKMGFQSIQRKLNMETALRDDYDTKVKMVDAAAEEARHISHQMMPRTLLEMGLVSAIDDMLQKTLALTDIRFNFEHYGIERLRFARNIEIGLYRICQELVNNIIKHSGATEVDIQVYKTKSYLVLHVEDNGRGFQPGPEAEKRGIGLGNIFSRASAVNGEVSYEEGRPHGTAANIRVPLAPVT